MKTWGAVLFLALAAVTGPARAALDRVADFALLDTAGGFHQLSRYRHRDALALFAWDGACPGLNQALALFAGAAADYRSRGIDFAAIAIAVADADVRRFAARSDLPLLNDAAETVAATLGLAYAGEVLLLDPAKLALYYRGPVGGEFRAALDGVLQGTVSDTMAPQPGDNDDGGEGGCPLSFPGLEALAAAPPDYATRIAPIIRDACVECHRPGGVGPFALDSHLMVLGWSPMIREVIVTKRMPPMQVDQRLGRSADARHLSAADARAVVAWIDAGAPDSPGVADPLTAPLDPPGDWLLGEPDQVVTAKAIGVAATGVMDYLYQDADLDLGGDRWLRAVQYLPGDPAVLHHLMTFVTAPGEDFWGDERTGTSGPRRFVGGFAPGQPKAVVYPEGTGVFIPAGHKLSMQFHYVTNGRSTVDETRLGLYFSDRDDLQELLAMPVTADFVLPPHAHDHALAASHAFPEDVVVTGVRARMSFRGKRMRFAVAGADGQRRPFFSIPAYNYGWQPHYRLAEPLAVAAGSRIWVEGALDNSVSNPTNPNPAAELRFGVESWEEMFTGYISYYHPRPGQDALAPEGEDSGVPDANLP